MLWIEELGLAVTSPRADYSVLRRVLRSHVAGHCGVLQDQFVNWWSGEFSAFLERVDPAFLIVGDGHDNAYDSHAQSTDEGGEGQPGTASSPSSLMRSLTLFLLSRNFRCIRLSELTSTANGIFAFQYAMQIEYAHQLRKQPRIPQQRLTEREGGEEGKEETNEKAVARWVAMQSAVAALPSLPPAYPTSRLALTCYALSHSLAEQLSASGKELEDSISLSKAVLLHSVLLSSLPLSARHSEKSELARRLDSTATALPFAPFLNRFFTHLNASLALSERQGMTVEAAADGPLVDLFDLRFLLSLIDLLSRHEGHHTPSHLLAVPSVKMTI